MTDRKNFNVSITMITPLIQKLSNSGFDTSSFLSDLGLAPSILESTDNKINIHQYHEIFVKAEEITGNQFISLETGSSFQLVSNILGYLMLNCLNPRESLDKYVLYQKYNDETMSYQFVQEGDLTKIIVSIRDEEFDQDKYLSDYYISGLVAYWQSITGKQLSPLQVCFRHKSPEDFQQYKKQFRGELKFLAPNNMIIVGQDFWDTPNLHPNAALRDLFEKYLIKELSYQLSKGPYTNKVQSILSEKINDKLPSENEIAQLLSITTRTLQKKLKSEGTNFRNIHFTIQKELTFQYLMDKSISITEISYKLGFSDPSAFNKAFSSWVGESPTHGVPIISRQKKLISTIFLKPTANKLVKGV